MAKERTTVRNWYQECKFEKLLFAKKIHANSNMASPDTILPFVSWKSHKSQKQTRLLISNFLRKRNKTITQDPVLGVRKKTRQRLGKEDLLRKGKVSKDQ